MRDSIIARDHPVDFDLTDDQLVNRDDLVVWVRDLKSTYFGDANLDGEFNSGDMVVVFTAGKYETGSPAVWEEGDWNADGTFRSDDLGAAFVDGGYKKGPKVASQTVPEPTGIGWLLFAVIVFRFRDERYLMIRSCMSYRGPITAR